MNPSCDTRAENNPVMPRSLSNRSQTAPKRDGRPSRATSPLVRVTAGFWIKTVLATIAGGIAGNVLNQTYPHRSGRFIIALMLCFVATLALRAAAREFPRATFWSAMFWMSVLGAVLAQASDTAMGIGDIGASVPIAVLLMFTFVICYRMTGAFAAPTDHLDNEWFFWAIAAIAQTFGSALADWALDPGGPGYAPALTVIALGLAVTIGLDLFTRVPRAALFWIAFLLTGVGAALGGRAVAKSPAAIACAVASNCRSSSMPTNPRQPNGLSDLDRLRAARTGASER